MKTLQELLTLQWNGSQKMVDHCLKNTIYVQSGDTFIACGSKKPGIARDLWYDDETEGPDDSKFEAFRAYNLRSNKLSMISKVTEEGYNRNIRIIPNYHGDKTDGKLACVIVRSIDDYEATSGREASDEEIAAMNEARTAVNSDYEKRLATYWKRYSDKVYARGYYANR